MATSRKCRVKLGFEVGTDIISAPNLVGRSTDFQGSRCLLPFGSPTWSCWQCHLAFKTYRRVALTFTGLRSNPVPIPLRAHIFFWLQMAEKSRARRSGPYISIDDFDDPMSTRIDQNRLIVDNSVAILGDAVLARHFVVRHTARGQISANPDVSVIAIRAVLLA